MAYAEAARIDTRRTLLCGALIGVGLMAGVDEIIFHQVLGWHHFYDRSTPAIGLLSDGLLHAAELLAIVAGGFIMADLMRQRTFARLHFWAALFLGLGGFQLFDGLVNHKVLRLHQIRYGVDLLPYDLMWNGGAVVLLITGFILLRRARQREA